MKHAPIVYFLLFISAFTFTFQQDKDNGTLGNLISNNTDIQINSKADASPIDASGQKDQKNTSDEKIQDPKITDTIALKPSDSSRLASSDFALDNSIQSQPIIAPVQNNSIEEIPSLITSAKQENPSSNDSNSIITQAPVITQIPVASVAQAPITPEQTIPNGNAVINQIPESSVAQAPTPTVSSQVVPNDAMIIAPNDSNRIINQAPTVSIPDTFTASPQFSVTETPINIPQVDSNAAITHTPLPPAAQAPIAPPQIIPTDLINQAPNTGTVILQAPVASVSQSPTAIPQGVPIDSTIQVPKDNAVITQTPVDPVPSKALTVQVPDSNVVMTQTPVELVAPTPSVTIPNDSLGRVAIEDIVMPSTPVESVVQAPVLTLPVNPNDSTIQIPKDNGVITQIPVAPVNQAPIITLQDNGVINQIPTPTPTASVTQVPIAAPQVVPIDSSIQVPIDNAVIKQAPVESVIQTPIVPQTPVPSIGQPTIVTQTPVPSIGQPTIVTQTPTIIPNNPIVQVPNDPNTVITQTPIASVTQAPIITPQIVPSTSTIEAPKDNAVIITHTPISSEPQARIVTPQVIPNDAIIQVPNDNSKISQVPSAPTLPTPLVEAANPAIVQVPHENSIINQTPTANIPIVTIPSGNSNGAINQTPIETSIPIPQVPITPVVETPIVTPIVPISAPVVPSTSVIVPIVESPAVPQIDIPKVNANATDPNITAAVPQMPNATITEPTVSVPNITVPNVTVPNITIPNIEIPTINSPRIDSSSIPLLNTSLINDALNHIGQQLPINQVAGPGITDPGANAVSTSTSQANNIKNIIASFQDLNFFGGNTANQAYTSDQIAALALLNSQIGISNMATLPGQLAEDFDLGEQIAISPIIQGKCLSADWKATGMLAHDIGVGSQGDTYAAGIDGHLYFYDFLNNQWKQVSGDFDLGSITRVDVGPDGTPYVVTQSGNTYYLNENNEWILLPGCSSDIAIGRGGEIYKIGCDLNLNGYGIYRLFKTEEQERKGKKSNCKCSRQRSYCKECSRRNTKDEAKSQYWFKLSGSGIKISISPSGMPYITNSSGMILSYEKSNWKPILAGGFARDISVSNDGELFYIDIFHNIFRIINRQGFVYQLCGVGNEISSGPFSQPFIIGTDHNVYTASKHIFN